MERVILLPLIEFIEVEFMNQVYKSVQVLIALGLWLVLESSSFCTGAGSTCFGWL